jgi:hypothetical protein
MTSYDILADAIVEPTFVASVVRTGRGLGHVEFHALLRDDLLARPAEGAAIIGRLADANPSRLLPGIGARHGCPRPGLASRLRRAGATYHRHLRSG